MPRVLITAFGPYGPWEDNSSWKALVELTRDLPANPEVTTRLYPVDFETVYQRLQKDLRDTYDYALHLGQAPGATCIHLEAFALNVAASNGEKVHPVVENGPIAFQTSLPLGRWARQLRDAGLPARVSYHAGTLLCNATMYLTHYFNQQHARQTKSAFIHLPLAPSQVLASGATAQRKELPSLPSEAAAKAIRIILGQLAD